MDLVFYFVLLAANWIAVTAQTPPDRCLEPIAFGKLCTNSEAKIKYHFDNQTGLCMAFKFNGCEGNENNFDSSSECVSSCYPTEIVGCPIKSNPITKEDGSSSCRQSEECGSDAYCSKRLSGGGTCCSIAVRKSLDADYNPVCGTRRTVVKLENDQILIGKSCKSNFCPTGSKCLKGTYFSTCCEKI
ncbi:hypothetical protein CAEBREN_11929 [Caenorhabditis brenneri]|uniref:BPTI/Kunitz inhibitor domain-containing protein n=1 Tax=Caenorhabditis brenneri TaxID=135651 RepID=G0MSA2_CAEBE|nr:hypothetical protein CAEBREN_11929 [Caenorhabditis brenneri]